MPLTGTHSDGDTGHVSDHNLIDAKLTDLQNQITALSGTLPDATTTVKGKVMLTNDLGGSAGAPTVIQTHLAAPLPIAQGGTASATRNFVDLTSSESIAGTKTFSISPVVPTPAASGGAANKSYVDAGDALAVALSGNQTVNGIKTYSSSPLVPTPTASGQAANKSYVDTTAASIVAAGAPDATTSNKGLVQLANDFGGTATAPTVIQTHLSAPLPLAQGGTGSATQNFVDLTTAQTVNGVKTFGSSPLVPTPTASGQAANKSYVDSAGGTGPVISHVNQYHQFDIRRFGAVGDGVTDNTAAFQNAIAAASGTSMPGMKFQNSSGTYEGGAQADGGGGIYVPPGVFVVGNLILSHRCEIWSDTWGAVLLRKASTSGDWITNRRDSIVHAAYCRISGLTLNGNQPNQSTAGTLIHFLGDTTFNFTNPIDEDYDVHCEVLGCQIIYGKGDAIRLEGSGENKILGNFIRSMTGMGIYSDFDNWIESNSVGHTGTYGMYISGDSCRVNGNKVWYTGEVTASQGQGFYITSDSGVGSGNSAQDCAAQGVLFDNAFGWSWSAFEADSCSKSSSGTYAGIDIFNSQYINVQGHVRNRYRNNGTTGPSVDALNHSGGSDNNYGEIVAAKGVWGVVNSTKSGSTTNSSKIRVNGTLI